MSEPIRDPRSDATPPGPASTSGSAQPADAAALPVGEAERDALDGLAFEVNTDASLVDPDWGVFAEEHERRFDLPIRYLKSRVRRQEHREYDNEVAKLRAGRGGYWVESRRFPAAFFGDTAPPEERVVDVAEAQELVWEAVALYRSGEAQSLTCIYRDADPPEVFFGYRGRGERWELGAVRSTLPLHLRVVVDADRPSDLVGARRGVFIYQQGDADTHRALRSAGRRMPLAALGDLGG